jgi:hypothetical protein
MPAAFQRKASVEEPGATDPPLSPPPKPSETQKPKAGAKSNPVAKLSEPEALAWIRDSLMGYMGGADSSAVRYWGPPDEEICRQVLEATNGASLALVGQALKELHRGGKMPDKSWGWFPEILRRYFQLPREPSRISKVLGTA